MGDGKHTVIGQHGQCFYVGSPSASKPPLIVLQSETKQKRREEVGEEAVVVVVGSEGRPENELHGH